MRKLAVGIAVTILFFRMVGPDVIGIPRYIQGQWAREPEQPQCLQDELTFMELSAAVSEETQSPQAPSDFGSCGEGRSNEVEEMPDDRPAQRSDVCDDDVDLLARLLTCEMGCSWIADDQQLYVGSVVLNRVASDLFPDTLQEVIYQPGQYAPAISGWIETVQPDERTIENARWLLENGSVLPENVLYQSTVVQGEVYDSYYDADLGTTTYYCYLG